MRQSGVALIQIMVIAAIISIVAFDFVAGAKHQLRLTSLISDKNKALLQLSSDKAQLLYDLKTYGIENAYSSNSYNFFGLPKKYGEYSVITIQDNAGLLHLHYPDEEILLNTLIYSGIEMERATSILNSLLDWQDLDIETRGGSLDDKDSVRNGAIPHLSELSKLPNLNNKEKLLLESILTPYTKSQFNPLTAPNELLRGYVKNVNYEEIKTIRNERALTESEFLSLAGIYPDFGIIFLPSNILTISIRTQINQSIAEEEFVVEFLNNDSDGQQPFNYLSTKF